MSQDMCLIDIIDIEEEGENILKDENDGYVVSIIMCECDKNEPIVLYTEYFDDEKRAKEVGEHLGNIVSVLDVEEELGNRTDMMVDSVLFLKKNTSLDSKKLKGLANEIHDLLETTVVKVKVTRDGNGFATGYKEDCGGKKYGCW